MTVENSGAIAYALENSMPDSAAPTSAANSAPSPVLTSQPRARERKAQPPVASTTAPARTR